MTMRSKWIWASTFGLAVGIPAGLVLGAPLEVVVGAMIVTPLILALCGVVLGTSQWMVLRGLLPRAGRWVALTALGSALGLTISVVTVEMAGVLLTGTPTRIAGSGVVGLLVSVVVVGGLGGSVLGVTQALALRAYPGATRKWGTASGAGLALGFGTGAVVAMVLGGITSAAGTVAFLLVSGLTYSVVTGETLRALVPAV